MPVIGFQMNASGNNADSYDGSLGLIVFYVLLHAARMFK